MSDNITAKMESMGYEVLQSTGTTAIGMQANIRAGQDNVPFREAKTGKPREVWVLSGLLMADGTPRSYGCKTMIQLKEALGKGHKIIPAQLLAPIDGNAEEVAKITVKRKQALTDLMPKQTVDDEAAAALATYNEGTSNVTTSKNAKTKQKVKA